VHLVVNQTNQSDLMINEWKSCITKALQRGEPFTMLVQRHTKAQPVAEVVIAKEEKQLKDVTVM
jgi:hypothetical protein